MRTLSRRHFLTARRYTEYLTQMGERPARGLAKISALGQPRSGSATAGLRVALREINVDTLVSTLK